MLYTHIRWIYGWAYLLCYIGHTVQEIYPTTYLLYSDGWTRIRTLVLPLSMQVLKPFSYRGGLSTEWFVGVNNGFRCEPLGKMLCTGANHDGWCAIMSLPVVALGKQQVQLTRFNYKSQSFIVHSWTATDVKFFVRSMERRMGKPPGK